MSNLGKFAKKTCSHEDLAKKISQFPGGKKNEMKEFQKLRKNSIVSTSFLRPSAYKDISFQGKTCKFLCGCINKIIYSLV